MKNRHIKGQFGPGGIRCFCCGGSVSRKTRSRLVNRTRRRADQVAIQEQLDELDDAMFDYNVSWYAFQWVVFSEGVADMPRLQELYSEMEGCDALIGSSPFGFKGLVDAVQFITGRVARFD